MGGKNLPCKTYYQILFDKFLINHLTRLSHKSSTQLQYVYCILHTSDLEHTQAGTHKGTHTNTHANTSHTHTHSHTHTRTNTYTY